MEATIARPPSHQLLTSHSGRLSLGLSITLFAWLGVFALVLPIDPDEVVYSLVSAAIMDGSWPYRDIFDHKQPLTYLWYMPAGLGLDLYLQRLIAIAAAAASIPIFGRVARRWLTGRQTVLALVAYTGLLANPWLRLGTNLESFLLLPLVAAVAVPSALVSGLLLGVAIMTKTSAAVFLPVLLLLWRRDAWRAYLGAAVVIMAVCLPFVPIWSYFWDANVSFNAEYGRLLTAGERIRSLLVPNIGVLLGALPLWVAAVVGLFRASRWMVLPAACAFVGVKATGFDFPHYYTLLVPPAALLAAIGLDVLLRNRAVRVVGGTVTATSLALMFLGIGLTRLDNPVSEAARSEPGELYVLGPRADIYELAGREPQRLLYSSVALLVRPEWGERMKQELLDCPPDIVVIPKGHLFRISWSEEIAQVYGQRREFPDGTLLTRPRWSCEEPAGRKIVRDH